MWGGDAGVVRMRQSYGFCGGMGILPMILHGRDARATVRRAVSGPSNMALATHKSGFTRRARPGPEKTDGLIQRRLPSGEALRRKEPFGGRSVVKFDRQKP